MNRIYHLVQNLKYPIESKRKGGIVQNKRRGGGFLHHLWWNNFPPLKLNPPSSYALIQGGGGLRRKREGFMKGKCTWTLIFPKPTNIPPYLPPSLLKSSFYTTVPPLSLSLSLSHSSFSCLQDTCHPWQLYVHIHNT